jgi:Cof subfamily protein (haloacid dehalogenase superfamily)
MAVFDMDGTLLGPDKTISGENLAALARLRAEGVAVVIASGRHHEDIAIFEEQLGLEGWVISAGGAMARHAATGELLYEMTLSKELGMEALQQGKTLGLGILGYHRSGIFCEELPALRHLYTDRTQLISSEQFHLLLDGGMQKLIWTGAEERILELLPGTEARYEGRAYVVNTETETIEFHHPQATKAAAAEAVARKLGISPGQVIAFGDGNNDVPLLRWAGMSVAMAHGRESAKAAAKTISPPGPSETAVARALAGISV